jgi:hypothetical protein
MAGGLEFLIWITKTAAVLLPLVITLYGLFKRPRDLRLVWAGLLTAVVVSLAGLLIYQRNEKQDREIAALKKEIEEANVEPARRSFTPEQRNLLIEKLREIHGPSVFVLVNSADEETARYAREIGSILKEAGWEVPASFGMIYTPVILPGQDDIVKDVVVGVSPEVPRRVANAFLTALREGGVRVSMGPHWPGTEHPISIFVGPAAGSLE